MRPLALAHLAATHGRVSSVYTPANFGACAPRCSVLGLPRDLCEPSQGRHGRRGVGSGHQAALPLPRIGVSGRHLPPPTRSEAPVQTVSAHGCGGGACVCVLGVHSQYRRDCVEKPRKQRTVATFACVPVYVCVSPVYVCVSPTPQVVPGGHPRGVRVHVFLRPFPHGA